MDNIFDHNFIQLACTCAKSIIETLEQQIVKLVQN